MKEKKSKLLIIILITLIYSGCKFPKDEIEDFQINLNGNLVNTLVNINLSTEDTLPVEKISFSISGKNAVDIFDLEGKTNFNAEGGNIGLILAPTANPTPNNPWSFVIEAEKEGYLPIREEIFLFNNKQKISLKYVFKKPTILPIGTDYKAINLNFLGKKRADTVSFTFDRSDGIQFIFKYPTAGLVFMRKSLLKLRKENLKIPLNQLLEDTNLYIPDTGYNTIANTSHFLYKYNKNPNEQKINSSIYTITSATHPENIRIGFKKPELNAEFESRIAPDTIALNNVRANIISSSTFSETGFYDEAGNYIESLTSFPSAIGIPQIYFYDARTGNPIEPYYPNGAGGLIVEAILPTNIYKLFAEGIDYSTKQNLLFETKRIIDIQNAAFEPTAGGKYKLTFKDNFLSSRYFLFLNSEASCGFATVQVSYPNIPLNKGFTGTISVSNSKFNITYANDFTTPNTSIRLPAFGNEVSSIKFSLDHPVNKCRANPILFSGEVGTVNLCNYTLINFDQTINFNPSDFLATISGYAPLFAKASIKCPSGNFVIPPTITLNIWQLSCNAENVITFEGGEFYSTNMIEKDKTYIVRYDKMSSSGKPTRIYDTLEFNTSIPEMDIVDQKTGYWRGTLKYNANSGFRLEVLFDNNKMKYKIPNCN